jgi:hypothetical protein
VQISRRLEDYLPPEIVQVYQEDFGVTNDLYPWQVHAADAPLNDAA